MYWPECSCTLSAGNFVVNTESEKDLGKLIKRMFVVKHLQSKVGSVVTVKGNTYQMSLFTLVFFLCDVLTKVIMPAMWTAIKLF